MTFKKGHDINRFVPKNKGLTEFHNQLGKYLRDRSLDAVEFLLDTMNNEKASLKLRVVAAVQILDRGIGKPVDRSIVATMDATTTQDVSKLDTKQLEAIIANLDTNQVIIDVDCKEVN